MLQDRQTEQTTAPTTTATPTIEPKSSSPKAGLKGMTFDQGSAALAPGGSIQMKTDPSNTYGVTGAEGTKAVGVGKGNRPGDVVDAEGKVENSKVEAKNMGSIPAPDLDKIPTLHEQKVEGKYGSYAGTTVKGGAYGKADGSLSIGGKEDADGSKVGKAAGSGDVVGLAQNVVKVKGPSVEGQAGYSANAIAGMKGEKTGKYGKVEGDIHAQADAYIGASGKAGISEKGAVAEGKAGLGVSVGVAGEAAYTTPGIKVEGVDKELTAGAKVEGSAEAYAKAGVEGGAYLTKDMIGLKGSAKAGAGVKAEAKGTVHMGPISVTGKASGIAGAEASAEGSFYYADGKLHIGGSLSAALGIGGELGLEVVIDVKQSWQLAVKAAEKAKELGIKGYKAVYNALDHDGDGKISAQDFAAHGADAVRGTAKAVDKGVDGLISALDQDGDGKFSLKKDGAAAAGKAWDATKEVAGKAKDKISDGIDYAKDKVSDGIDYAKDKGKQGVDWAKKKGKQLHGSMDQDKDGKLGLNDVKIGATKVANKTVEVGKKVWTGAKSVYNKGVETAQAGWAKAQQWYGSAKSAADRNGDGKLDWNDVVAGAKEVKQTVGQGAKWAKDKAKAGASYVADKAKDGWDFVSGKAGDAWGWLKGKGSAAKDAVHGFLDQNNDGKLSLADARAGMEKAAQFGKEKASQAWQSITETYNSTVQHASEAYQSAKAKLDVNGDGKIDSADAKAAAKAAGDQLKATYHSAVAKAKELYSDAKKTVSNAVEKAKEIGQSLKTKLDANGDGKLGVDDIKLGAKNAWNRTKETASKIKEGASKAWDSAAETMSGVGSTLKSGFSDAKATLSGSWNKLTSFFGG